MNSNYKIEIVNKCHDIQVSLGNKNIPEYDAISEIGMMVRLSLHIRGLPLINYDILKLVADYYLQISSLALKVIVNNLAEIEFVKIDQEGSTIKSILPTVPYFDDVYESVGDFAFTERNFSEPEAIALEILTKLSDSPLHKSSLFELGADKKVITHTLDLGEKGGFLIERKARGKDIILSPTYFTDNAELYTDLVAKAGASNVSRLNTLIKQSQGLPLSIIEKTQEINGSKLSVEDISMLKRLAQDGAIAPPSIKTSHSGLNYFMFTPTPGVARLQPGKKEIYERAIAMVASVRQGQLLPNRYAIRSPYLLLSSLKSKGFLRANTEATEQYKKLALLRMCTLEDVGGGYRKLQLIDAPENHEALGIAISLIQGSATYGTEIDEDARFALQQDQEYIESKRAASELRATEKIPLDEEHQYEIDNLLLEGVL